MLKLQKDRQEILIFIPKKYDIYQQFQFLESISVKQKDTLFESSKTQRTQSLSIISENNDQLQIQEIIAFYDQLDTDLIDDHFGIEYLFSEKDHYKDINEILNQRILLGTSNNSRILAGILVGSFKLIAIKYQRLNEYEQALRQIDEFRIHNKINQNFPDKSLQLITPVVIQKLNQQFNLFALTERGECNLYEYSRVIPINQEQAYSIFKQIIIQIANLHSINIAHRDVKPQNIFYVKNKGWLLSDFGESQEYDKVESTYNIRGTLYFLMPQVKQNISNTKLIEQNLLANDLYALVVTIIVIQSFNYMLDIQSEIKNLQDPLLLQCLHIRSCKELEKYIQCLRIDEKPAEFNEDFSKFYIRQQFQIKEHYKFLSIKRIADYHQQFRIDTSCLEQLLKFIQSQLLINQFITKIFPASLRSLFYKKYITNDHNSRYPIYNVKQYCKLPIDQQEYILNQISIFGYLEKPIKYGKVLLKQRYDQNLHLELIKSLYRAEQFKEAFKELIEFNSTLRFSQLDHIQQHEHLNILRFENLTNNRFANINLEIGHKFQLIFKYSKSNYNQLVDKELLELIDEIKNKVNMFDPLIFYYIQILQEAFQERPIHIYEQGLKNILNLQNEVIIFSIKLNFLGDLGCLYILENKFKEFHSNNQRLKQLLFKAESNYQAICIKFGMIRLQIFRLFFTNRLNSQQLNKQINYYKDSLLQLSKCQFQCYQQLTFNNLTELIRNLVQCDRQYLTPSVFFILESIICSMCSYYQFQVINHKQFLYSHYQALKILFLQRNFKRCRRLVSNSNQHLTSKVKNLFKGYILDQEYFITNHVQFSSQSEVIIDKRKKGFLQYQYFLR